MTSEKTLSLALTKALRLELPGAVVIKHCDRFTSGVPDLSVTWRGLTTWLELKYLKIEGKGVQDLTAQKLARSGSCYYVLYTEGPKGTRAIWPVTREVVDSAPGHDHNFVVEFIRRHHTKAGATPIHAW